MDAPGGSETARRPGRGRPAVTGLLAAAVLAVVAGLAFAVKAEVTDRRSEGFCRSDHGIAGAGWSEEPTWWPLGERCRLELADGTERVREPGWALTALVVTWTAAVGAGVAAPAGSARRTVAWVAAVPAVPVAVLIGVTIQPRSVARLVSLTAVSVGFGAILGAVTAAVVWSLARGRLLATVLGSWLAWSVVVFAAGRDSIGP